MGVQGLGLCTSTSGVLAQGTILKAELQPETKPNHTHNNKTENNNDPPKKRRRKNTEKSFLFCQGCEG